MTVNVLNIQKHSGQNDVKVENQFGNSSIQSFHQKLFNFLIQTDTQTHTHTHTDTQTNRQTGRQTDR